MSMIGYAVIAGINAIALIIGALYIRSSIRAAKESVATGYESETEQGSAAQTGDHFGSDFVAFLLIIYGGLGMLGGFFWLLYVILEAVR